MQPTCKYRFQASIRTLSFLRKVFLDQVIHFGGKLGDQQQGHSPKNLKSLIEVPYVANLKVQVVSFNMILISSPQHVPRPSYPYRGKFGRTGKGSSNEKAITVDRASLCNAPESTGSKLQYDPYLISVACSQTELTTSEKLWEIR